MNGDRTDAELLAGASAKFREAVAVMIGCLAQRAENDPQVQDAATRCFEHIVLEAATLKLLAARPAEGQK